MSVTGIGIDLVTVARIQHSIEKYGDRFKKRIYSATEIQYCDSKPHPSLHYAARFAAKEAFVKALGTGFRFSIKHTEIETQHDQLGKPVLVLYGKALEEVNKQGVTTYHLSLSHTDEQATAVIVLEK
jgi:holo-[acyl-carrier protein] synthase